MRALLIALTLLSAGCLASEPAADDGDTTTEEPPAVQVREDPVVVTGTGTIVAGAGGLSTSQGGGDITVPDGTAFLLVEWTWDDPVIDLDGALSSPSAGETQGVQNIDHTATGGAPGAPDSPHSLLIELPEPGAWSISMTANGAAAQTEYSFAASAFPAEVPEGYSAL